MSRVDVCGRLRADIRSRAAPAEPDLEPGRDFYPRSRLEVLLTPERTLQVLRCQCENCRIRCEDLSHDDTSIRDTILGTAGPRRPRAVFLFALLTLIECPQLIRAFLRRSGSDEIFDNPLSQLSDDRVRAEYWPAFDEKEPQTSKHLSREFGQHKYQFAVPMLQDRDYAKYENRTILPFCKEISVGAYTENGEVRPEGSSGRVYSFEIVDGYRNFEDAHAVGVRRFVRKEFHAPVISRFNEEIKNLELVKRLNDPHIVKIITWYKHGDHFNIIFPCAKTNLGLYIRDERYGADALSAGSVEAHPFWREMLGVAKALDNIMNNVSDGATGKNNMYGYHFDLKPANILIEDAPPGAKFLISDFGQARFKQVDGTSKTSGVGGTECYAPPEVDQRHTKRNRKYDIWSLGCILLEVCAFVVGGYAGVRRFDLIRRSISPSYGALDDYYWHRLSESCYELKPQIVTWMQRLSKSASVSNARTYCFIEEIMALVKTMLEVNMDKRASSNTVHAELSILLDKCQPLESPAIGGRCDELVVPEDLAELGRERLAHMQPTNHLSSPGSWYEGRVKLVESRANVLTMWKLCQEPGLPLQLGPREELSILPYPGLSLSIGDNHSSGIPSISILCTTEDRPKTTKIFFDNPTDAIAMQSVLLGQNIRRLGLRPDRSLSLCSVSIEKRPAKIRSLLSGAKAAMAIETLGAAPFAQLWAEQSYWDPAKPSRKPSRDMPRATDLSPAKRRIVIFSDAAVLVVPIARNSRVEKSKDTESRVLKIVPTDRKADPSFVACLLRHASKSQAPYALPLHRGQLDEETKKGRLECSELKIVFQSEADLILFNKAYIALKRDWKVEDDRLKESRKEMGEQLGWAAN